MRCCLTSRKISRHATLFIACRTVIALLLLQALAVVPRSLAAQVPPAPVTHDTIRGRVTADSGRPVTDASVLAAAVPPGESHTTGTDSSGNYEIVFAHGSGNYIVTFAAPGYQISRQRVIRRGPPGTESLPRLDAALVMRPPQGLSAVRITAARQERRRPPLRESDGTQVGNAAQSVSDPLAEAGRGEIASIVANAAGVNIVPSTDPRVPAFSVLGLPPGDNTIRLEGLTFSGTQLPAAARVAMQLQTTEYDAAVGGFSGGAVTIAVQPGSNFSTRELYASVNAPALEWTDAAAQSLGSKYRNLQLSGSLAGPLIRDKLLYSVSAQVAQHSSPFISLANADPTALAAANISPQAATNTIETLRSLGLPDVAAGGSTRATSADLLGRFDIAPTNNRVLDVVVSAELRRESPTSIRPTATPSQAGIATAGTFGVQAEFARYVKEYYLMRLRSGVFLTNDDANSISPFPAGMVRVGSTLGDASPGLANIAFGGSSAFPQSSHSISWQTTYEAAWFAPDGKHRPKLTGGLRLDVYTNNTVANRRGTFAFNSLQDLTASNAALFTRTLSGGDWHSKEASGWISAGDLWQITDNFSLQYGVRGEANRYGTTPMYNSLVDSLFGLRTDRLPNTIDLSPRAGFSWSYGRQAKVSLYGPAPRGVVHGGLGAFRSVLPVTLPGSALSTTGLPGALSQITCVGPAAPQPDWSAYGQDNGLIPSTCADGRNGTNFADAEPHVSVISPQYAPSRASRATLGWAGDVRNLALLQVNATYSLNLHLPSTTDLNLANDPSFFLPDEGGRPVFAEPSQIDPSTGGIAPLSTRKVRDLSGVSVLTSDLRSESRQLSFSIQPTSGLLVKRWWSLGYAYTRVRDRSRGFDGADFGDPRTVSAWGPAAGDIRHSVTGSFSWLLGDEAGVRFNAQMRSGAPYSPMIAGDVNGDGLANDLAFVFDPAHAKDSTLAQGMRTLLTSAPSQVRDCLKAQLGRAAGRNSCRAPWTTVTSGQFYFNGSSIGLPNTISFRLVATNLFGGLDALLHGSDNLRGWGQPAVPDPVLFTLKAFNSATQSFQYQVNPAFGETRPFRTILRTPFAVTLSASLPLGAPSYGRQTVDALVRPGRSYGGKRLTAAAISVRARAGFLEPVGIILGAKDSLVLSAEQAQQFTALRAHYLAASDSIWKRLGDYLAGLPTAYSETEMVDSVIKARAAAGDLLAETAREVRAALTPDQLAMLAPELLQLLDEQSIARRLRLQLRYF